MKKILSTVFIVLSMLAVAGCGDDEVKYVMICPDNHHPHAIDLGLPSGTKWACCNVGAKNPYEYGGYFAFGESWEKTVYSAWSFTKYPLYSDNVCYLDIKYDVAYVRSGGKFKTPSYEQLRELAGMCTIKVTYCNGVYGAQLIGQNGNSIFLPFAGCYSDSEIYDEGVKGIYATNLAVSGKNSCISFSEPEFMFGRYNYFFDVVSSVCDGRTVRAVCP